MIGGCRTGFRIFSMRLFSFSVCVLVRFANACVVDQLSTGCGQHFRRRACCRRRRRCRLNTEHVAADVSTGYVALRVSAVRSNKSIASSDRRQRRRQRERQHGRSRLLSVADAKVP